MQNPLDIPSVQAVSQLFSESSHPSDNFEASCARHRQSLFSSNWVEVGFLLLYVQHGPHPARHRGQRPVQALVQLALQLLQLLLLRVQAVTLLGAASHQWDQGVGEQLVHQVDDCVRLGDAGEEMQLWGLFGLRKGNTSQAKFQGIIHMMV